jgi:hypothetical protein
MNKKIIQCDDDGCYMVYADKWTDLEGNPSNDCIKCRICDKVLLRF